MPLSDEFAENSIAVVPRGPVVLLNVGDDDPNRGDANGKKGIGRRIAEKYDSTFLYVDAKILAAKFPDVETYAERLNLFLLKHGQPDIVLETMSPGRGNRFPRIPNVFYDDEMNDDLPRTYIAPDVFARLPIHVPSHLEAQDYTREGDRFAQHYPGLPSPLIGIMLVEGGWRDIDEFAKKLTSICTSYPRATIFVCGARQTPEINFIDMMKSLRAHIEDQNLTSRIDVLGHDFARYRDEYNPYVGLIDRADHLIVYGPSRSIVSEVVSRGKSVYMDGGFDLQGWREAGLSRQFYDWPKDQALETHAVEVPDTADLIADGMVRRWRESRQPQRKSEPQSVPVFT